VVELKEIARSLNKTLEEVEQIYAELQKKLAGKPERVIKNALISELRHRPATLIQKRAPLGYFTGFLIGDVGLRDQADEMRRRAERVIDRQGFDYARQLGLVDDQGRPLDTRTHIFGRQNPNFGKPIPDDAAYRSHRMYLIVKEANSDKWELAHLQTNDPRLSVSWCELPFNVWVQFPALIQNYDTTGYRLTGSTAKDTPTKFKQVKVDEDPYSVFESLFKDMLTPIKDVEKYHEAVKDAWDRWICCYGIVGDIFFERVSEYWGTPGILLDTDYGFEEEHQVVFYVPNHIGIDFQRWTETYVFGRTRRRQYRDPETNEWVPADVVIDVFGFQPNPEYTVKEKVESVVEESLEGFIPLGEDET